MIIRRIALRTCTVGVAIALWWALTKFVWDANPVLSRIGPSDAVPALFDILSSSDGWLDVRASLLRLISGLSIAFAVGVPLGIVFGTFRGVEDAATPLVNFFRMISPLAWAPLVIVAFGVGTAPVVFLIAVTAVWPLVLGTSAGVRAIQPGWRAVTNSLGATPRESLRLVTIPAVRGHVLTALRLALGVGWIVLVPAEMLGVDSGLGYAVLNARDQLNYAALGGTVLLIGVIGFMLDATFRYVLQTSS
jgi:NitT/TauT family transport system permease protein